MLNAVALFFIFFLIVCAAVVIVFLGSLPGKIARRRGHPWPDAVNAASWIGLATGVLWPFAFVWAFFPFPVSGGGGTNGGAAGSDELAQIHDKLAALESALDKLQPQRGGGQK